jgi:hypothetical protein
MADRDWDKELAKVDKQLASLDALGDRDPVAPAPAAKSAPKGKSVAPREAPREASREASREAPAGKATTGFGVYARLTLSVLLAAGMVAWPYEARCGVGLAAYLAAVVVVVASGIWSSVWTWRHRANRAHTLSLLLILWGLVLGSMEVLPRVGYATPTLQHPAGWACK